MARWCGRLSPARPRTRFLAGVLDHRARIPVASMRAGPVGLIGLLPLVDPVLNVAFGADARNLHLLEREMLRTRLR